MTAPRRRWSFGLRTLFVVVTIGTLACWIGWQAKLVRDRRQKATWVEKNSATWRSIPTRSTNGLSWIRRVLGDRELNGQFWFLPEVDRSVLDDTSRLFPESEFEIAQNLPLGTTPPSTPFRHFE